MGPPVGPAVKRPREDSNLGTRLRRAVLYPLSYGGFDVRQASMNPKFRGNSAISRDTVELRMLIPVGHHQFRVFRAGLQELADHRLPGECSSAFGLEGHRGQGDGRAAREEGAVDGRDGPLSRDRDSAGPRQGQSAERGQGVAHEKCGGTRPGAPGRRSAAVKPSQSVVSHGSTTMYPAGSRESLRSSLIRCRIGKAPVFLAEISSSETRGRIVTRNEFMIVLGLRHQCGHPQLLGEQKRTLARDAAGGRAAPARPVLRGATGGEGVSAGA